MRLNAAIRPTRLLGVAIAVALLLAAALGRIAIDTDIVRSLPTDDPVIADGVRMFETNPIKDRIAVDLGVADADLRQLLSAAETVEDRLRQSGLFTQVGNQPMQAALVDLAEQVVGQLPLLFTAGDLQRQVAPLLTDEAIRRALTRVRDDLSQMDGIGQAATLARDPLGLRHLVLARLGGLNPAPGASIHGGRIVSADGRHLLILATPAGSGTDTAVARALDRFFQTLQEDVARDGGGAVTLTPTGAYRAALDNETIVRGDVNRAILWATLGIGGLLLAAFSRPLLGLMALLPALAGTVMALFVFSLLRDSISIMVLGFGGAVVSITVDHGIAYLLFLERGGGAQPAREIRAVGLLAVLTSVGAFGVLALSGFAVFEQLGLFTAMGIGFAFLFVHMIFPHLLPAAAADGAAPRQRFSRTVDRLASAGRPGLVLALAGAAALALFMRPHFDTDLAAMNSVRPSTRAADEQMAAVWGDIFSHVYLMTEADDLAALQLKNDRLLDQLDTETHAGAIARPVTPSLFFPGRQRAAENLSAWKAFWSAERIRAVSAALLREGNALGFAPHAFDGFVLRLTAADIEPAPIPATVQPLFGIVQDPDAAMWRQTTRVTPAGHYDGRRFYQRLSSMATVFDPALFSQRMGTLLVGTFMKMLLIISVSLVVLLMLFFADMGLLLTALLPLAAAFAATLGTLGLMGRPLDIPALMLSVVILGMGVDYTLMMVRGYQRYRRFDHPHFAVVRTALVMAAASTLVGFAVLLTADHSLLLSAGLMAFLGIGYCLAGALLILPPLLKRRFESGPPVDGGVAARYADMEPYPRLFARFKLRLDPLFGELATLLADGRDPATILDVGCGYGVPACWMAERFPQAFIHGLDPRAEQVRVAGLALGNRGAVVRTAAPDLPPMDVLVDLATLLDMSHYLQEWELEKTLERIHERLLPGGRLVMRSVLPRSARPHWTWYLEHLKLKITGIRVCYRDAAAIEALLDRCGFDVVGSRASGSRGDMWWHVATAK